MKITLSCPHAVYGDEMRIWCKRRGDWCAHVFFKRCKGWWSLTPSAAECPVRKEEDHDD